jgi:Flp pilus assembly protein TadD
LARARLTTSPADIQRAVDTFQELIGSDPHNAQNQLQYGVALVLAGDTGGAEQAWLTAEDLAPTSAVPATNLVLLYLNTGRIEEASLALDRAQTIDPENPTLPDLVERLREATAGAGS